ncbi:minor tail protein [Microbacterium phage Mabodamaca]|uniref:Minor tail protein n=1 Tax=Microbacterium phage Mabodamaca TaxID=3078574 RepID=A0AA96SFW7_9CAUD|nr:minor tail protein [Microbacterium phage Mabodamaca]
MAVYTSTFSGRSAFQLHLHVNLAAQYPANYSVLSWALYIVETGSYGSYSFDAAPWSVNIAGQAWSGASAYDFRAGGNQSLLLGSGQANVWHDANGYASYWASASVGGGTVIGSSSTAGGENLPRIPKVPGAPLITGYVGSTLLGPQDVKSTSCVVKFSGTTDGGSAIIGWELHWAEDAAFTVGAGSMVSGGTSTVTGLKPGTLYYFRARGRNGVGLGPYSATASARTLAAFYVSDGEAWLNTEVYVSDGTSWHSVEVLISEDEAWVPAG